jgi:Xaa-Pro aminopeptidase
MDALQARVENLRAGLDDLGLGSLLITRESNVAYLSGFSGEASSLLISPGAAFLITDYRYADRAARECPGISLEVRERNQENLGDCVARLLGDAADSGLGFESEQVSHALYEELAQSLDKERLRPTTSLVESLRMHKQPVEIEAMRRAAELGDRAFDFITARIAPGRTERELGFELEQFIRKQSGEEPAFASILVSGEKTAQPHGAPGKRELRYGDLITMDFGARCSGYCSDMTRTVILGKPDQRQREVYQAVYEAQCAAVKAAREGMAAADLDQVARGVIQQAGFLEYAGDGLGHGLGLDVHEPPFMRSIASEILKAGMAVTIEPGIYIPDWGGVRIEDTVLITASGCERLTRSPKELITL